MALRVPRGQPREASEAPKTCVEATRHRIAAAESLMVLCEPGRDIGCPRRRNSVLSAPSMRSERHRSVPCLMPRLKESVLSRGTRPSSERRLSQSTLSSDYPRSVVSDDCDRPPFLPARHARHRALA